MEEHFAIQKLQCVTGERALSHPKVAMSNMNADMRCSAEHAKQNKSSALALAFDMRHVLELNHPSNEVLPDVSHSVATAEQPDPSITDIPLLR